MEKAGVLKYQGRTFIAIKEPVLKVEDQYGICTFYGFREIFLCDPEKNKECVKGSCQKLCRHTFQKEYAKDNQQDLQTLYSVNSDDILGGLKK